MCMIVPGDEFPISVFVCFTYRNTGIDWLKHVTESNKTHNQHDNQDNKFFHEPLLY